MRRSRRSLAFLLVSIALSLVIVRSTSAPAGVARTKANLEPATRQTAQLPSARNTPRRRKAVSAASSSTPRAQDTAPVVSADRPRLNQNPTGLPNSTDAPPASRGVSATAIVVVLPSPAWHALPSARAGWSGCMSYANGCDHLGRCYPRMESPRLVDRLFLRDLARIVDATASLSADTVAMLIRSDWSSVLSRVASDRGLSKSQPSARQTNWSEWRL